MPGRPDTAAFIRSTFRSVWSLELMCFLRRNASRSWPADELVAALRASDVVVDQGLASLVAAGLVVLNADGSARYQPASAGLDALAGRAEQYYARSPDTVRRLIVASASNGATAFADAFRLRKD